MNQCKFELCLAYVVTVGMILSHSPTHVGLIRKHIPKNIAVINAVPMICLRVKRRMNQGASTKPTWGFMINIGNAHGPIETMSRVNNRST